MALRYRVYERENKLPNAKTPRVAVAVPKMMGQITLRELADDIADRCTVHRADVRAVLDVLSVSAVSYLTKGFGVDLGDLGSFAFRLRSKSAPTKAEFTADLVKRAMIRYTPSLEMKARMAATPVLNMEDLLKPKKSKAETTDPGAAEDPKPEAESEPKDGDL